MDRGILVGNRLCARRVEEHKHARHINKLSSIKPSIDNSPPVSATLGHLRVNLKREQLIEESFTDIDRANRILLQKMSDIVRKPSVMSGLQCSSKVNRSLNHDSRRKELKRITDENQSILRRIQHAQSTYDHVRWEQDFRRTRVYLKNKCEHPLVLDGSRAAQAGEVESLEDFLEDGTVEGGPPPVISRAPETDLKSLAKEGKRIGDTFYLIEVSTDGEGLWISAFSGQEPEGSLELYLDKQHHENVLQDIGGEYSRLVERVTIRKGRLLFF